MAKRDIQQDGNAVDSIKTTDISAITVNSASLEKIIGVSDSRIRQLARENIIIRAAKGRYKLLESIKNYILTLKVKMEADNSELSDEEIDLEEEKAIHERVKRRISELKLQTMKGELHKSEDVEIVMMDMLVSFKTKIMGIPSKMAPILENRDAAFIKDCLTKEVIEALNELKDYDPKAFYSDEYVEESESEYEEEYKG